MSKTSTTTTTKVKTKPKGAKPLQGRQQPNVPRREKSVVKVVNTKGEQKLVYSVPHCTSDYLKCLYDPFNTQTGVCIPTGDYPLDSFKGRFETKGTLRLGTSGIGFICMCPPRSNSANMVKYTNANTVGAQGDLFGAFTNLSTANFTDIPYSSTDFVAGNIYARTVSAGIRVTYRGKFMDMNGVIATYEHRDHGDCFGLTYNSLCENPGSFKQPVTTNKKEWQASLCYSGPAIPGETDFNNSVTLSTNTFMFLAISGIAGDQYEFEVCQHLEFIGPKATAVTTTSHTDAQGFGQVVQAVKTVSRDRPLTTSDGPSLWAKFKDSVASTLPRLVTTAAEAVLPGPLKGLPAMIMTDMGSGSSGRMFGGSGRHSHNGRFPSPWGGGNLLMGQNLMQPPTIENADYARALTPWTTRTVDNEGDRIMHHLSIEDILNDEEAMLLIMERFLLLKRERSIDAGSTTSSPKRDSVELRRKCSSPGPLQL